MKAHIIYAHPNPKSFNAAILGAVKEELEAKKVPYTVSDLYAMKFNPVLSGEDFMEMTQGRYRPDVAAEQQKIRDADTIFFQYPIWWAAPPAMLKGYIDRVFSMRFAYQYTDHGPEGLLGGKRAVLIMTYGNPREVYQAKKLDEAVDRLMHDSFIKFCGMQVAEHVNLYAVPRVDDAARKQMLEQVRNVVRQVTSQTAAAPAR